MPKITTKQNSQCYYRPTLISESEVEKYEKLGIKVADIPQDIFDKWKEHCEQVKYWDKFWCEFDEKLWEGE